MADAAELYWVHGMKVAAVARELDVSTSTVSRLLSEAKRRHIIESTINRQEGSALDPRHHLEEMFISTQLLWVLLRYRMLSGEGLP